MENNLTTPWCFRDGREYIVSINVHDKPKSIGIIISDKITAEEWSCHYDLKYIEELTQRTGNYKPFDTFISMIKTALLKSTDAVSIDLISYDDLKALKTRRLQHGFDAGCINSLLGSIPKPSGSGENKNYGSHKESGLSQRKYIIVTYIAEFDNVHYPIPLTYSGPPDPTIMQKNIRTLQNEISLLKNSNLELMQKLDEKSKVPFSQGSSSDNYPRQGILRNKNRPPPFPEESRHSEIAQMQKLLASVHQLEQKMVSERAEHLEHMEKLQVENNYLREKINELQITEQQLNRQISRLEETVASKVLEYEKNYETESRDENNNIIPGHVKSNYSDQQLRKSGSKNSGAERTSYRGMFRNQRNGGAKLKEKQESIFNNNKYSTNEVDGNGNRRSSYISDPVHLPIEKKKTQRISNGSNRDSFLRSRSRTASPATPRFNPTAYVLQKKAKQEELAKNRLAKIEARWKEIGSGRSAASSRSQSRNCSPARSIVQILPRRSMSHDSSFTDAGNISSRTPRTPSRILRDRRRLTSQSPPRNVESRLKQRKKNLLERGREIERRVTLAKVEKKLTTLTSPRFQKSSKKVEYEDSPMKQNLLKKLNAGKKNFGVTELDLRLKDVESSLNVLQAFIDATGGSGGHGHSNNKM